MESNGHMILDFVPASSLPSSKLISPCNILQHLPEDVCQGIHEKNSSVFYGPCRGTHRISWYRHRQRRQRSPASSGGQVWLLTVTLCIVSLHGHEIGGVCKSSRPVRKWRYSVTVHSCHVLPQESHRSAVKPRGNPCRNQPSVALSAETAITQCHHLTCVAAALTHLRRVAQISVVTSVHWCNNFSNPPLNTIQWQMACIANRHDFH